MHEATIAMAVIEQAIAAARANGASRVTRVELEVGVLRGVVHEAMQMAFEACAVGTPVEGAVLVLNEVAARARCRQCGCLFEPDLQGISFACPACSQADVELVVGNDILLKSLECEAEEA